MQSGIYTFVEITPDAVTGEQLSPHQRMRNLMEEIELAEEANLMYLPLAGITGQNIRYRPRL